MTIDERIERLTERHEALAQSLELSNHILAERHEALAQSLELSNHILTEQMRELAGYMGNLAVSMTHLSETAIDHEHRLRNLEGGRA
jgi:hypothetical protein